MSHVHKCADCRTPVECDDTLLEWDPDGSGTFCVFVDRPYDVVCESCALDRQRSGEAA